jgi:hypothetical protein
MERPSSGTLKTERLKRLNNLKVFESNKTKWPKQDRQNQLQSPEEGKP